MTFAIKVTGTGWIPEYRSAGAAGADLRASSEIAIAPAERAAVPTALHIEIPPGYVGLIWPRSGLALRHGIDTLAGVVDSDYRGELLVVLVNHGVEPFVVRRGDRIAQLLIQEVEQARFWGAEALAESERGESGFGSTGR